LRSIEAAAAGHGNFSGIPVTTVTTGPYIVW